MMQKLTLFERTIEFFAKISKGETSKALMLTGVVTWTLSGLAQIAAIHFNKKIPQREKSYLIPQEAADAAVNIGLFYTFCQFADKYAAKLLDKGVFISKKVKDVFGALGVKEYTSVQTALETQLADSALKNKELVKSALRSHARAVEIVGILSGFGASLVACNIITPYCRNKIATYFYNRKNGKNDPKLYPLTTLKTYQFNGSTKI